MADNGSDIKGKVGLDTTDFKAGVQELNRQITVINSGFKAAAAGMDDWRKSEDGLQERIKALTGITDLQKQKVSALTEEYKKIVAEKGANSKAAQDLEIRINNETAALNKNELELKNTVDALDKLSSETDDIGDDFKKIGDEAEKAGNELEEAGDDAEKSGSKFEKLGGILKGVGAAVGGVVVAAGAAAVKLGQEVVQQFGELEQNLGGSEAVFGEYAASIQKTGEEAYKNLGVSQSEYLATANKMGALFQGSGVEQQKSLELTEKAMQRAADMASVMGIDMQVALDSVAGAAKGNFTMMDNLGVAMNATNIEAYALANGLDFTWKTASNAEKAEVAMQMFFENTQQYAGNFANEATQTVSGSLGLLQAALGSFTAGLGNTEADMTNLTENLVDAFQSVVENIVPILENIVAALPEAANGIINAIGGMLPTLLETVTNLFTQVLNTLLKLLPELIPAAVDAVMTIVRALIENLPLLIGAAVQLVTALVSGIGQALPQLIPAAVDAVLTVVTGLIDNIPLLIDAALKLITGLVQGILQALPVILQKAPEIIKAVIKGIVDSIPLLVDAAVALVNGLIKFVTQDPAQFIKMALDIVIAIAKGLVQAVPKLVESIPKLVYGIIDAFTNVKWSDVGKNIINGIIDGIKNIGSTLKEAAVNAAKGALDGIKGFFGIKSPSTVMRDQVGVMLGAGMADGIEESEAEVNEAMKGLSKQATASLDINANIKGAAAASGGMTQRSEAETVINLDMPINLDGRTLTRLVGTIQVSNNNAVLRNFGVVGRTT